MRITLRTLRSSFIFLGLTLLSQVGGLVYLIYKPISIWLKKKKPEKWVNRSLRVGTFSLLMIFFSYLLIPPLAKIGGRVPLPVWKKDNIKPATILTTLLNRHYVSTELYTSLKNIASDLDETNPGSSIIYLDANFPFLNGFPLLPHKSHDDGEKLDISYLYKSAENGKRLTAAPTFFGYGFTEGPQKGEYDQIAACKEQGFWQYDLIGLYTPPKPDFEFDESANKALLELVIKQPSIKKVFIEPHLKTRLQLEQEGKIRFHGCPAVRHDDHIHLEL